MDTMPFLLVLIVGLALSLGLGWLGLLVRRSLQSGPGSPPPLPGDGELPRFCSFTRPAVWLAIEACNLGKVQHAFGLREVRPCSWAEGFARRESLFISPPVKGWVLVAGEGLPDPADDVDIAYRFISELSRKLGRVQFFWCNRILLYHGWAKAERGRILRAYAWGGQTLWNQGAPTPEEKQLQMYCVPYGVDLERSFANDAETPALANTEKVPLLAAQWSLDPARMGEECPAGVNGLAGKASLRF